MTTTQNLPFDEALFASWAPYFESPSERDEREVAEAGQAQPENPPFAAVEDDLEFIRQETAHNMSAPGFGR